MAFKVGHQDFYPSGGKNQVSCGFLPVNFICDHSRAVDFFIESLNPKCQWSANPCSSWTRFKDGFCRGCGSKGCPRMGYYADQSKVATDLQVDAGSGGLGKGCYAGFGCFDDNLKCNSGGAPQSPSTINTEFYLCTRENRKERKLDWKDDAAIKNSGFRGSRETKFIIHGFNDRILRKQFFTMKDGLLDKGDFNVILVNWEDGADDGDLKGILDHLFNLPRGYKQARQNARLVGRQIAELSRKLHTLTKAPFTKMHLIGHSLGAHVAGFAGERLFTTYREKYGRITGLDPAGPGYEKYTSTPDCLLEKSDAKFVDIIHTDGILGNEKAVGHQDFYPSGGKNQISCGFLDFICDHMRAIDLFNASLNPKCQSWRAYPCEWWWTFQIGFCRRCGSKGCPRMGYYADQSKATGKFMLETKKTEPYCK